MTGRRIITVFLLFITLTIGPGSIGSAAASSDGEIQAWYGETMPRDERVMLQIHLTLVGTYNSLFDGDIGPRSIKAIRAYQRSIGALPTGLLYDEQQSRLKRDAAERHYQLGLESFYDPNVDFNVYLPSAFLSQMEETELGTRYYSNVDGVEVETVRLPVRNRGSLERLYETLSKRRGRQTDYSVIRKNWFIVSGTERTRHFYTRFFTDGRDLRGFSISYENYLHSLMSAAVVVMSNSFSPYHQSFGDKRFEAKTEPALPEFHSLNKDRTEKPKQDAQEPKAPSSGTGFFVSKSGYITTNAHVVEGCSTIDVVGWKHPEAVYIDTNNDLAVLRVETEGSPKINPLRTKPSGAKLGEDILALGYPLRGLLSDKSTDLSVTTGVVSNLSGIEGDRRYLTISAPVQPGNSGGPLVNRDGEVLGVVSAKLNALNIMLMTGDVPQNVNFAVKSQLLASHLLIAGVPQSDYESTEVTDYKDTASLVAALRDSIVLIKCQP